MLSMKEEDKIFYEAPVTTVVTVKTEGVICVSLTDPDDYTPAPDPFGF